MQIPEKRNFQRHPLCAAGCTFIRGDMFHLKTHNVSLGGALVEFTDPGFIPLKTGLKLNLWLEIGFKGRAVIVSQPSDNGKLHAIKFERFDGQSVLLLTAYFVKHGLQT